MAELEKFNLECLERINELRRQFRAPPLRLRLSLILRPEHMMDSYNGAQDWAHTLSLNDILTSDNSAANYEIGECICRFFSEKFSAFSGTAVINAWFDEAIEYKGAIALDKVCHPVNFLQLISSQARYCGFGFAVSRNSSAMYAVARFKPALPAHMNSLAAIFNQQVHRFESLSGSATFKSVIQANLSQDVTYVKRNLQCGIPQGVTNRSEWLHTQQGRYSLSHLIRQTRVSNRIGKHQMGLVYANDFSEKLCDIIIIMQNDEE